ncbi:TauD/TfdA family dioxygenase [Micromonospora endophytica]|uniref:Taurine catabolism dioxygenase TauD n=1 Tax=Micromonospora endophytica TaxID=515350 RepID=A0A2W2E362_9ACTN|nr:TauD/TfdA family dioxygenase [Micromonospora endophytica]PZF99393.1 taurine catabolism dioxygenase TauD [Micromonospora endophytica]RIW42898.1 taurine catabolism dioxygenase TauD [Micromonospora endophytica]
MPATTPRVLRQLLADATTRATVPAFDPDRDRTPLRLPTWQSIPAATYDTLCARVDTAGFALVEADRPPRQDDLRALADTLGLGEPFVPPLYRRPGTVQVGAAGVSRLTAAGTHAQAPMHPATSAIGQNWHVDGTLQHLGEVRTTLLLCVRPAASGGQSLLFNAAAAFLDLADRDPGAAAALMTPGVLVRTATVNGSDDSTAGPGFAVIDQRLMTRYSRTHTDRWLPASTDPDAVDRALTALDDLAKPGSPYRLEFTMTAGQGIVLANSRVCHGRAPYTDDPDQPRELLRALFTTDLTPR